MKSQVTKETIKASIYGLLIGDALGCPVEGCTAREIRHQFGRLTEMEYLKERQFRPKGLHSDDGQQAIALCDALLRHQYSVFQSPLYHRLSTCFRYRAFRVFVA